MKQTYPYLVPISVIVAGALVAVAVFLSGNNERSVVGTETQPVAQKPATDAVRKVTAADHIKGDINAPVKIIEYSDFECPFCQQFHHTLSEVMETYVDTSEVAWVFRQFPIEQLHSKAPAVAMASECAAELGGNDAFWQFTDRYFEVSLANNRTDIETVIPQLIQEIGIEQSAFQTCFDSERHLDRIQADFNNAAESGGLGTPWSIVVAPNGKTFPLSGAQPIGAVEQLIEIARSES